MTNRKCLAHLQQTARARPREDAPHARAEAASSRPSRPPSSSAAASHDVSELSMHALIELQRENDAAVAADPTAEAVTYLTSTCPPPRPTTSSSCARPTRLSARGPWRVHYLTDAGATFDDHFDDAFSQLFALGYDAVVSVGGRHSHAAEEPHHPGLPVARLLPLPRHARFRAGAVPGVRHVFGWLVRRNPHGQPGRLLQHRRQSGARRLRGEAESHRRPLGVPVAGGRWDEGAIWPTPSRACAPSRRRPRTRAVRAPARARLDRFPGAEGDHSPNENHDPRQYIDK